MRIIEAGHRFYGGYPHDVIKRGDAIVVLGGGLETACRSLHEVALIKGVTGQDGAYLAQFLLGQDCCKSEHLNLGPYPRIGREIARTSARVSGATRIG